MRTPLPKLLARGRALLRRVTQRSHPEPTISAEHDQALVQHLNHSRIPSWAQFSYLFRYLGRREGWVFRIALIALFGAAALLVVRYVNRHWIPEPATGGSYTEAVVGAPRFINPVLASSDLDTSLVPLLFSGLLRLQTDGTLTNDLAENVEVTNDGKTYRVTLKPDLRWHDGEPLTAQDVVFTVGLVKDPNVASPRYAAARDVSVEAADDRTVVFTLENADAAFRSFLTLGILPAHIWSGIPAAAMTTTDFNVKPIGNGPYKFKEVRKKEKTGSVTGMTLERFPSAATPARIDTLRLRFVDDGVAAVEAVSSSQADGVRVVSTDLIAKAKALRGTSQQILPLPQVVSVFFNVKRSLFERKEVRLALRAATNQAQVIDRARPDAPAANSPLLPGMPGAEAVSPAPRGADLDAARKLLEDAGWKKEGDLYARGSVKLEFTLVVPDVAEYVSAAQTLVEQWKELGANVELQVADPTVIGKDIIKGRAFDAILYSDRYDANFDLYPFWHSTQSFDPGLNLTSFYNKEVDAKLTEARQPGVAADKRAAANAAAARILVDEAPALFLYQSYALIAQRVSLRATSAPTLLAATQRFLNVHDWYVKTDRTWKWAP